MGDRNRRERLSWRERLAEALRRQALPRDYVERLVEELSDHAFDLVKENRDMNEEQALNERIGAPETLAAAARIEYQRRSFAGRHPVLTFVAAPVFAAPAAVCFFTLAAALAAHAVGALFWPETLDYLEAGAPTPDWVTTFVLGFCATVRFVPFAATAALFAHLGRRVCRPNWGLVACGMIALLAGLFAATVRPPLAGDDRSSLTLALSPALDLRQLFQAVVPLACGVWLLRRAPLAPANPLAA